MNLQGAANREGTAITAEDKIKSLTIYIICLIGKYAELFYKSIAPLEMEVDRFKARETGSPVSFSCWGWGKVHAMILMLYCPY